jgi:hypothetical protein
MMTTAADQTLTEGTTDAPEEQTGPQANFYVLRAHLDKVHAKAAELEVELEIDDVDPEFLFYKRYPQGAYFADLDKVFFADLERMAHATASEGRLFKQTAWRYAEARRVFDMVCDSAAQYAHITVHAPAIEDRIVGVATIEGSDDEGNLLPRFAAVPGEESEWDPERVVDLDFHRCDVCGKALSRRKVFLIKHMETGDVRQVGGKCASNLDLARKMRRQLKALRQLEAFVTGAGDEDEIGFGGRGFDPGFDQRQVLVLADMMIRTHGYVSGSAAYHSDVLVSTKERVLEAWSLLYPSPFSKQTRSDKEKAAELRAELAELGKDREELYEQAKAFVEEMYGRKVTDFSSNCRTALYTGSRKMVGFLVWIPAGLAKEASRRANRVERSGPWTPSVPTTGEGLDAYIGTWGRQNVLADLGLTDKAVDRALAKPDKALTKALSKKLDRHVPGTWKVARVRDFASDFGTVFFLTLYRVSDGAEITWKTSTPYTVEDERVTSDSLIRIHSASVGEIPPARTVGDKTYQDGRRINRVKCSIVDKT